MKKVILTIGAPGSGKTTWATQEALKKGTVRISRDDIRSMMGNYWVPEREGLILRTMRTMFAEVLKDPYTKRVIIDETNLNPMVRLSWLEWILDINLKVNVEYKLFLNAELSDLQKRNANRQDHRLPEELVVNFYEKSQDYSNSQEALERELEQFFRKERDYRLEAEARRVGSV